MSNITRVATIQMVSTPDIDANLGIAKSLLQQASDQGAELAVLPEYFPLMSDDETAKLEIQEAFGDGPLQSFLSDIATQHGLWIMAGTIPLKSEQDDHIFNSCLLFNPAGDCVARYDKIHLFDVHVGDNSDESYNESTTIVAGNQLVVADTPFSQIGMSICYDLRFPELYRKMLDSDITLITVPAAFTETTGRRHWEFLLRTRAVENLCFVIASNQAGQNTQQRRTWGHSMIIGPWGDILASLDKGNGIICADLDFDRMLELRSSFPALQHKKLLD